MWYNYSKAMSHNALFNFIISNRGIGKTYGYTKFGINQFLKGKGKFILLRRYKTELKDLDKMFKSLVANNEFEGHELTNKGKKFLIDKQEMGYAVALTQALTKKSVDYSDVSLIIFEEFIIDKQHIRYLQNEVEKFLEFFETTFRLRDNVRVVFLGNNVSVINPYFIYFNISLPAPGTIKVFKDEILVENYVDNEFIKKKYQTRFGKLIKGTSYGDYAIENKSLKDSENFIAKRSQNAKFLCTICYENKNYGVWLDWSDSSMYVSDKLDPSNKAKYILKTTDLRENYLLIKSISKNYNLMLVKESITNNFLYYETLELKAQFNDIIKLIIK